MVINIFERAPNPPNTANHENNYSEKINEIYITPKLVVEIINCFP